MARRRAAAPAFDRDVAAASSSYASLVGVAPSSVAVGSQVSVFAGLVAASLPAGSQVLVAEGEFTSIVFPFLAQAARGVRVREVPLDHLPDAVSPATTLIAVSAVQSANGRLARLDQLTEAAADAGADVLLDTTQATGWLPVDAGRFAYTVGGGYKWLLAPRGTSFFTVRPDRMDSLVPHTGGWYAGADVWTSIYGGAVTVWPRDARRFDVSPAWHSWVGQAASLDLAVRGGCGRTAAPATPWGWRIASVCRWARPTGDSAIVSLDVTDDAADRLRSAGVTVQRPRRPTSVVLPRAQHRGRRRPGRRGARGPRADVTLRPRGRSG